MIWRHRGITACLSAAEDWLRADAAEANEDIEERRAKLHRALEPIDKQLNANPRNSDWADVQLLPNKRDWFIAYLEGEFDTWAVVYEIVVEATETRFGRSDLRAILPLRSPEMQQVLFGD
ncbi:MAG: hypothetical protein ACK5O2_12160 [Microthrixaceae bacterium]